MVYVKGTLLFSVDLQFSNISPDSTSLIIKLTPQNSLNYLRLDLRSIAFSTFSFVTLHFKGKTGKWVRGGRKAFLSLLTLDLRKCFNSLCFVYVPLRFHYLRVCFCLPPAPLQENPLRWSLFSSIEISSSPTQIDSNKT